jgi:hypothetical protein
MMATPITVLVSARINSIQCVYYLHSIELGPVWPSYTLTDANNIVFDANVSNYIETDTYRKDGIDYIIDKYLGQSAPWGAHDQS